MNAQSLTDVLSEVRAVDSDLAQSLEVAFKREGSSEGTQVAAGEGLAAAVAKAKRGAVLVLGPGEHRLEETLKVKGPLTLSGAGAHATWVRVCGEAVGIQVNAKGALTLRGLSLVRDGSRKPKPLLIVAGGEAVAEDCAFFAQEGVKRQVGIRTKGRARLTRCLLTLFGSNLIVRLGGHARVDACAIVRCGEGVAVEDQGQVTLERSLVLDTAQGVTLERSSQGSAHVSACTFQTTYAGVEGVGAECTVHASRFRDAKRLAVALSGQTRIELRGNTIENCLLGLVCDDQTSGVIADNTVRGPTRVGVQVRGTQELLVDNNAIEGVQGTGIALLATQPAVVHVRGNTIRAASGYGIAAHGQADARLEGNDVRACDAGLVADGRARLEAWSNVFAENEGPGARLRERAQGLLRDNEIRANGLEGVLLEPPADAPPVCVRGNRIEANGHAGIFLHGGSQAELLDNMLRANARGGVVVSGSASPRLRGNTYADTRRGEVILVGQAEPQEHDGELLDERDLFVRVKAFRGPTVGRSLGLDPQALVSRFGAPGSGVPGKIAGEYAFQHRPGREGGAHVHDWKEGDAAWAGNYLLARLWVTEELAEVFLRWLEETTGSLLELEDRLD